MNEWNEELRRAFDQWCDEQTDAWCSEGADIDEVRSDLAAQVERWRREARGPFGGEQLLDRLGEGHHPGERRHDERRTTRRAAAPASVLASAGREGNPDGNFFKVIGRSLFGSRTTAFWGVFFATAIFFLESLFHWCAAVFFDPLPSPVHGLLVVVALAGSFLTWRAALRGEPGIPAARFVAGAAAVIGTYYSLLVIPIIAMAWSFSFVVMFQSPVALLLSIPLVLIGSAITAAPLWLVMALYRWRRFWWVPGKTARMGILAGFVALAAAEGPRLVARISLSGENVSLARVAASREVLLLTCYEGSGGTRASTDTSGWIWGWFTDPRRFTSFAGRSSLKAEASRLFYYRVTGKAFNATRQPRLHGFGVSRQRREDIDWDPDTGGDAVASRLSGLSLASSRLDGHVEAASRIGYWEWTLVFRNTAPVDREARMQMLLPPGGVVSRLTLWVNGEPQEAAFGSAEATAKAYKAVAVVQRRDPVLARWIGPDRNLVQCFPVPRDGGEIKIRLGITAAISESGSWELPRIIERNFRIDEDAENAVWVQGDADLAMDALDRGATAGPWRSRKGAVPAALLAHDAGAVRVEFGGEEKSPAIVWCRDPFAPAEQAILISEPAEAGGEADPIRKVVAVIDGSAGVGPWRRDLVEALERMAEERTVVIWFAGDHPERFDSVSDLGITDFAGGRDSAEALERAFEEAGEGEGAIVVWFHGTQPVAFPDRDALHQVIERRFHKSRFAAVALENGGNRLLEKLAPTITETGLPRIRSDEDLKLLLEGLVAPPQGRRVWRRAGVAPAAGQATEVGDQLARWHAWEELRASLGKDGPPVAQRQGRATRYQLVTPWSGAVVLERKEDYAKHDLEQIDPSTAPKVPTVPEPGTALLVIVSACLLGFRRRR